MTFAWSDDPENRVTVGDISLEYRCYGPDPASAPTILMLHEGLGSMGLWRDWPQVLADRTGYGVMVYSRAGYGASDPAPLPRPLDYMTREAMDTLPVILDRVGITSVILLGHSDGATIAAVYAGGTSDHRVRGLILIAPHFFAESEGLEAIRKVNEDYHNGDLRDRLARHHTNVDVAFRGWADSWLHPDFVEWDVTDAIDYLRIPVLAIQGTADEFGTLAQIKEIENRIYAPVDTLILQGCGHAPHKERPEPTTEAVVEFAERLARIEAATVDMG